ncbi:hypothetical protein [Neptuniibacter sp. QD37_11]|uniref:hypothetical protein n=1 Tax=Neptuniibacter sp. QD37_11 TaxID=3398209 RepID=UPI0039F642E4
MIRTYRNFIADQYNNDPVLKELYGSVEKYIAHYPTANGFGDWLETLRNSEPSLQFIISLAKTFITIGKRSPSEMNTILSSISRQYDVEIPLEEGILTAAYWVEKNKQYNWTGDIKGVAA